MKKLLGAIVLVSIMLSQSGMAYAAEKVSYPTGSLTVMNREATKTADMRVVKLKAYLQSTDSPMPEDAEHFVKEADRLGLDWRLVAAISGNESYFGQLIPENSYNGWGWGVWTGTNYGMNFADWKDGITTVSEGLKDNYINSGAVTLEQIGHIYAADPFWASKVTHFMNEIETFQPDTMKLLTLAL